MRTSLAITCALVLSACNILDGDGVDADLENSLPVDGCSWVVHIRGQEYAPDRDSVVSIKEFTRDKPGFTKAKVIYELTGRTGQVNCGWGGKQELSEISLIQISAPQ
jgi:hypothetical protein